METENFFILGFPFADRENMRKSRRDICLYRVSWFLKKTEYHYLNDNWNIVIPDSLQLFNLFPIFLMSYKILSRSRFFSKFILKQLF